MAYVKRNQSVELGIRKIWAISCADFETAFNKRKTGFENIGFSVKPAEENIMTFMDYVEYIYPKVVMSNIKPSKALPYWLALEHQCNAECGGLWAFFYDSGHIPLGSRSKDDLDSDIIRKFKNDYEAVFNYLKSAINLSDSNCEIFKQLGLIIPFLLAMIENSVSEQMLKKIIKFDVREGYKILDNYSDMELYETSLLKSNDCMRVLCNFYNMLFNWIIETTIDANTLERQNELLNMLVCFDFSDFKARFGYDKPTDLVLDTLE